MSAGTQWPLCAECEINTVRSEGEICYDCKKREQERRNDDDER